MLNTINWGKALQGAILVALLGIGGVLYSIRKNMTTTPPAQTAATQPVPAPTPAVAPVPEQQAPVAAPQPVQTQPQAAAPAPRSPKPSALSGQPRRSSADTRKQSAAQQSLPDWGNAKVPPSWTAPPAQESSSTLPAEPARAPEPPPPPPPRQFTVPTGTPISIRLLDALNSERNRAGDPFQGSLEEPIVVDGVVVADRGASVYGRVVQSQASGRVAGVAEMSLELNRIRTVGGEMEIASDTMMKKADTTHGRDAATVGGMAGIGAAIGAIAGGRRGAGIGAAAGGAGGAGTVAATKGKPVKYDPETRLTFRLRAPITVTVDPSRVRSRDNRSEDRNNNNDSPDNSSRPRLRRDPGNGGTP